MDFFSNVSEVPKKWSSSYVKPTILMGVKKKECAPSTIKYHSTVVLPGEYVTKEKLSKKKVAPGHQSSHR